ncbi:MAG TPA: hypothetical protein VGM05_17765 [Planctomycetaceae bacterium]|jgi:hypothetical protein
MPHQVNGTNAVARPGPARSGAGKRTAKSLSFHSEAEQQALMTGAGARRIDSLKIDYRQPNVYVELSVGGHPLLDGPLVHELTIDGLPVPTGGEWKSVCSYGDEDGDYLELQLFFAESLRIDRQLFLSRHDHFALLADAVIAAGAARVEHHLRLPVAKGTSVKGDGPTREWQIGAARVFPLWLPQDRVLSTAGDCVCNDSILEMSYTVGGAGLYLPVIFDWHPRHRRAAADWRSLTVSEPGRIVSPCGAAGHRLRIGIDQLLIFRGLAATHEPRAVLGQHTWFETLIGRFDSDGELEPIMATEVE